MQKTTSSDSYFIFGHNEDAKIMLPERPANLRWCHMTYGLTSAVSGSYDWPYTEESRASLRTMVGKALVPDTVYWLHQRHLAFPSPLAKRTIQLSGIAPALCFAIADDTGCSRRRHLYLRQSTLEQTSWLCHRK